MRNIAIKPIIKGQIDEDFKGTEIFTNLMQRGFGDFVIEKNSELQKIDGFLVTDGYQKEEFKGIDEVNELLRCCSWGDDPISAGKIALDTRKEYGKNATLEFVAGKKVGSFDVKFPQISFVYQDRFNAYQKQKEFSLIDSKKPSLGNYADKVLKKTEYKEKCINRNKNFELV